MGVCVSVCPYRECKLLTKIKLWNTELFIKKNYRLDIL